MAITAANEVFARKIALENLDQSAAYSCAYNTTGKTPDAISKLASRLANSDGVAARIVVLRGRVEAAAVKKAARTLDDEMQAATVAIENAQALGQVSAEVAAIKLRATLGGHLTEKKADAKGSLDDMDVESLLKLKAAVEDKVERSREALAMTDSPAAAAPPPAAVPIRRVIG